MAESKYFPDLQDGKDKASVEPIKEAFSAVETDVKALDEKIEKSSGDYVTENLFYYGNASIEPSPVEDFEYTVDDNEVYITKYNGTDEDVVIPHTIEGMEVTVIDDEAFKENSKLYDVTIPSCVVTIGDNAFYGCKKLGNVIGGSGVDSIDSYAFGNTLVTEVNFNNMTYIGEGAFISSELTKIDGLLNKIEVIPASAFAQCDNLRNVFIPDNVKRIDAQAFMDSINLHTVVIPKNITEIKAKTFYGCVSLTDITIPSSVTSIANDAFNGIIASAIFYVEQGSYAEEYVLSKGYAVCYTDVKKETLDNKPDEEVVRGLITESIGNATSLLDSRISEVQAGVQSNSVNIANLQTEVADLSAEHVKYLTTGTIEMETNTDYRMSKLDLSDEDVPTLAISVSYNEITNPSAGFISWLSFPAQDVAPTVIVGEDISFSGVDCDENGNFVPVAGVNYSLQIRNVNMYKNAKTLIGNVSRW